MKSLPHATKYDHLYNMILLSESLVCPPTFKLSSSGEWIPIPTNDSPSIQECSLRRSNSGLWCDKITTANKVHKALFVGKLPLYDSTIPLSAVNILYILQLFSFITSKLQPNWTNVRSKYRLKKERIFQECRIEFKDLVHFMRVQKDHLNTWQQIREAFGINTQKLIKYYQKDKLKFYRLHFLSLKSIQWKILEVNKPNIQSKKIFKKVLIRL